MQTTNRLVMRAGLFMTAAASAVLLMHPILATAQGAAAGSTLEQRVAQRKAERKIALTDAESTRLKTVCTSSQGKLRLLQQQAKTSVEKRTKVYNRIEATLLIVTGKLRLAEKDTAPLDAQHAKFTASAQQFNVTAQAYLQTLDDLATIDCKADPIGFKALLETARQYRSQIRTTTGDIKNITGGELKTALSNAAKDLQAGSN